MKIDNKGLHKIRKVVASCNTVHHCINTSSWIGDMLMRSSITYEDSVKLLSHLNAKALSMSALSKKIKTKHVNYFI